ncbi:MAG TPA: hypothetical protein PKC19_10635, partial [Roseiflexaceae bacterium]|nr:hypothetical protein [Roseiflexaceae bacterium]
SELLSALELLHSQHPPLFLGDPVAGDFWLTERGELRIIPFTLARPIGASPIAYRAPELASSAVEPAPPSDIYAVTALLYHVLTGYAPPTYDQIRAGTPLTGPRSLNPAMSPLVEQALLRGLQQRDVNRYQTAREMRVAFETVRMMGGRSLGLGADVLVPVEHTPPLPAAPAIVIPPPVPAPTPVDTPIAIPAVEVPADAEPTPDAPAPSPAVAEDAAPVADASVTEDAPVAGTSVTEDAPVEVPPEEMPEPERRGGMFSSTGCLIALVVGLVGLLLAVCLILALVVPGSPLRGVISTGAVVPTMPAVTPESSNVPPTDGAPIATGVPQAPLTPIELGPNAISAENIARITRTLEITASVLGPVAYSPDGSMIAVGVSSSISLIDAQSLDPTAQLNDHSGKITTLAWSADGSLLASGASDDNDIRIWDTSSGSLVRTLRGHSGWIRSLAFSPDGRTLASGSTDLSIRVWDATTGAALQTLTGHGNLPGGIAFSPDGTQLVSASRDGTVRLWDVAAGSEVDGFNFQTAMSEDGMTRYWATGVAFSPDGRILAVGSVDGNIYLLDAATGNQIRLLRGHTNWIVIRGLAFSPDGQLLYSASLDSSIRMWDVATGAAVDTLIGHRLDIFSIALSPDGTQLLSVSDQEGRLVIWDTVTRQPISSLRVGQGLVTGISFSPDNFALALTGYNGTVQLRLIDDGTSSTLPGAANASQTFAFLPNGRFVLITEQQTIVVVDLIEQTSEVLRGLSGRPISVATSRDGRWLVIGSDNGDIGIWEDAQGVAQLLNRSELPAALLMNFSFDGRWLAVAGPATDPRVAIYDIESRRVERVISGPTETIAAIGWQPGGMLLAAASLDGVLWIWDATTGALVRQIVAPAELGWYAGMSFSPDGRMIATSSPRGVLQFWDITTGDELASIEIPTGLTTLAFSPNGEQLAVALRDNTVQLFGIADSQ